MVVIGSDGRTIFVCVAFIISRDIVVDVGDY